MEAKELRIGNYLNSPLGIGQVTGIQDRDVTEVDEIGYIIEETRPIPLTEEWLLKFGFEKYVTDKAVNYKKDMFRFTFITKGRLKGKEFLMIDNRINYANIKYVHQLQNIYFALTGEELEIKEYESKLG